MAQHLPYHVVNLQKGKRYEKNYFKGFMMDAQWVVNGLISAAGALLYLLYKEVKKDIERQEELLDNISEKIHEIDKLVAGDYVKKGEFSDLVNSIFAKLDKIYDKLEKKADK